jgi:D-alanine transaminase
MPCRNVPVSEAELRAADEIWLSGATRGVIAVTTLDDRPVSNGRPGPVFQQMHSLLTASVRGT